MSQVIRSLIELVVIDEIVRTNKYFKKFKTFFEKLVILQFLYLILL